MGTVTKANAHRGKQTNLQANANTVVNIGTTLYVPKTRSRVFIYTDGSKWANSGGYAWVTSNGGFGQFSTNGGKKSSELEITAICEATMVGVAQGQYDLVILSDSKGGLGAIKHYFQGKTVSSNSQVLARLHHKLQGYSGVVHFAWCKGHSGVVGNAAAHTLAIRASHLKVSPSLKSINVQTRVGEDYGFALGKATMLQDVLRETSDRQKLLGAVTGGFAIYKGKIYDSVITEPWDD